MTSSLLVFHHNIDHSEFNGWFLADDTLKGEISKEKVMKHLVPWFKERREILPDEIHVLTLNFWFLRFIISKDDVMIVDVD